MDFLTPIIKLSALFGLMVGVTATLSFWLAYELLQKHKKDLGGR